MTHTEVGNNSLLATIKDLLELGIDDCLKVNVKIRIGILEVVTDSFIPQKNWEELLPSMVELINNAQLDADQCEEDFKDNSGYIDAEGISHDSTPEQAYIAYLLLRGGMSMGWILQNCDALKYLYNSLKIYLQRDFPDSEELSMLKEVKDIQLALFGTDDDDNYHGDEHIVFIEDEYPAVLLDEIYAKLKESE